MGEGLEPSSLRWRIPGLKARDARRGGLVRRVWRRLPEKNEIGIRVFDKVLLGGLLLLAGFFGNKYIVEPDRADRAFEQSFAEVRVQKVAVVWSHLDEIQANLEDYQTASSSLDSQISDVVGRRALPTEEFERRFSQFESEVADLGQRDASIGGKIIEVRAVLAKNRFWIGDDLYPQYVDYWRNQRQLFVALTSTRGIVEECSVDTGGALTCGLVYGPLLARQGNLVRKARATLDRSRSGLVRAVSSPA